jgi:carbonic anhydrase/acetyltransferase-like protein (isoleucine patch superfamily)
MPAISRVSDDDRGMLIKHRGAVPTVDPSAWVAPTATLVGDVRVGPHARVMYGAVLDAEGAHVEVGAHVIVSEHAVLRATAVTGAIVELGDHVFVGPHATVLGARVGRCAYLAANATVLQLATVGAGACVAVGALVHARSVVPEEFFVPPHTTVVGDPVEVFGSDRAEELVAAIAGVGFADAAFGVRGAWADRITRYREVAEVRSAEYAAHVDDEVVG